MSGTDLDAIIAKNLNDVREEIASAAAKAGRAPSEIRLVAVTKTKPLEVIEAAARAGQRTFGENYAQELSEKKKARPNFEWHFIGHLQSNKAKLVVGHATLIESVDRFAIADVISKTAGASRKIQDVLLQVHIGGEETKSGVSPEDEDLVGKIGELPFIRLRGLMSLPPLTSTEAESRAHFSQLRTYLDEWRRLLPREKRGEFRELSMGTSGDFPWAILEGATLVRVGTRLFGPRERKLS